MKNSAVIGKEELQNLHSNNWRIMTKENYQCICCSLTLIVWRLVLALTVWCGLGSKGCTMNPTWIVSPSKIPIPITVWINIYFGQYQKTVICKPSSQKQWGWTQIFSYDIFNKDKNNNAGYWHCYLISLYKNWRTWLVRSSYWVDKH